MSTFIETHVSHGITPLGLLLAGAAVVVSVLALVSLIVLLCGDRKE